MSALASNSGRAANTTLSSSSVELDATIRAWLPSLAWLRAASLASPWSAGVQVAGEALGVRGGAVLEVGGDRAGQALQRRRLTGRSDRLQREQRPSAGLARGEDPAPRRRRRARAGRDDHPRARQADEVGGMPGRQRGSIGVAMPTASAASNAGCSCSELGDTSATASRLRTPRPTREDRDAMDVGGEFDHFVTGIPRSVAGGPRPPTHLWPARRAGEGRPPRGASRHRPRRGPA
jgi:hypothetical protein